MHLRRTDKIKEAQPIALEKYLDEIRDFFDVKLVEGSEFKSRIFITTDDPDMIELVKEATSGDDFELVYNKSSARLGKDQKARNLELNAI